MQGVDSPYSLNSLVHVCACAYRAVRVRRAKSLNSLNRVLDGRCEEKWGRGGEFTHAPVYGSSRHEKQDLLCTAVDAVRSRIRVLSLSCVPHKIQNEGGGAETRVWLSERPGLSLFSPSMISRLSSSLALALSRLLSPPPPCSRSSTSSARSRSQPPRCPSAQRGSYRMLRFLSLATWR